MTGLLCALLLAAAPAAPAATPAKAAPTAALLVVPLLPSAQQTADEDLALAIQMRATALLIQTGRYADVSVKQILRMAEREGIAPASFKDPAVLSTLAARLGSSRALSAHVASAPKGWALELRDEKTKSPTSIALPAGFAEAVANGGAALAAAVAKPDAVALPAKIAPETAHDDAARLLAGCQASLMRQPIGIETPSILGESLDTALESCTTAAKLDPNLAAAHAGLALALALKGDDAKAVRALVNAKPESGYLPTWWIARYWLVTRYQSNEAGTRVLEDAIGMCPGFLLARGYLAEHLNAIGKHEEALAAWKKYADVSPKSPFVQARLGYTLARLGKHAEAIEATRAAVKLDPASRDLTLELASRLLDSGDLDGARAALEPLAKDPQASGEVLLRLGYVHLLKSEYDKAEPLLRSAIEKASRPSEWRTRGRAKLDLAKLMVRRGQKEQARAVMLEAIREGYRPLALARPDPDLEELAKAAAAEADKPEKKDVKVDLEPRFAMPKETSPFAITAGGDIDPKGKRAAPPPGLELVRF
ncbi:MAG TPA: tetratricopeptide repeat protein [Myxococcales bacterium]